MTVIIEFDRGAAAVLRSTLGSGTSLLPDLGAVEAHVNENPTEHAVVLGPSVDVGSAFGLAESLRITHHRVSVILVRRRVDSTLLAEALRAGVREVITEGDFAALTTAQARASRLAATMDGHGRDLGTDHGGRSLGTVVTVFSAKGGAGKTTVATNLAAILSQSDRASVALVDLDLAFGDAAIAMSLEPTHSIADAMPMAQTLDGSALRALMTAHPTGVQVLAAPPDPSRAESVSTAVVIRALAILSAEFDYVVVDCPPALSDPVLAALDASAVVALLATLDVPSLKNLRLTLNTLDLLAFPADRLRVLLNRSDAKVGLNVADVQRAIGASITTRIPSSADVPRSTNRGRLLAVDSPSHPVSIAIREFAESNVLSPRPVTDAGASCAEPIRRRGLLRRRAAA